MRMLASRPTMWGTCAMRHAGNTLSDCHIISLQKTAGGILLPKGPPKANSDAHFGTVGAVCSAVPALCPPKCLSTPNHNFTIYGTGTSPFIQLNATMQVIAMGSEVDLPLQKGDAIVYQKYAMVRFPWGGEEWRMCGKALRSSEAAFPSFSCAGRGGGS